MTTATTPHAPLRAELMQIAEMIPSGSRVLDVGCGRGELLDFLAREKRADARGIELSQAGVNDCVAKGLSVIQGDADTDLVDYPAKSFDFVILSQTIQATHRPRDVLIDLLRIGQNVIVSFPNFGHWRVRLSLLLSGRMPKTRLLSLDWYETPNIHLCTIADFVDMAQGINAHVARSVSIDSHGRTRVLSLPGHLDNLLADTAIFLLRGNGDLPARS